MRTGLKLIAKIVIVIGGVAAAVSVVGLVMDSQSDRVFNAVVLGASIGITISAGVLWMLAEISEQLGELPEDLAEFQRNRTAGDVAATPLPSSRQ